MVEYSDMSVVPIVSIIMPAYNSADFIGEAISSVQLQTYENWELIVIDDGSDDKTCELVEKFAESDSRIRLYKNEKNIGVAKTRNRGFDLCNGKYVALLDSDDTWYPEKIAKQIAILEDRNAHIAYSSYAIVDMDNVKLKKDYVVPEEADFKRLLKENVIGCSTVMLTRDIVCNYRFESEFFHEDYVLWLDLLLNGYKAVGCSETLVNWRYIVNSRSFNKRKSAGNRWKIYRKHLKLPLFKSAYYFVSYAIASIKKYFR